MYLLALNHQYYKQPPSHCVRVNAQKAFLWPRRIMYFRSKLQELQLRVKDRICIQHLWECSVWKGCLVLQPPVDGVVLLEDRRSCAVELLRAKAKSHSQLLCIKYENTHFRALWRWVFVTGCWLLLIRLSAVHTYWESACPSSITGLQLLCKKWSVFFTRSALCCIQLGWWSGSFRRAFSQNKPRREYALCLREGEVHTEA